MDWRLDERQFAGAEHLDPAYVSSYDRRSPTDWSEEVAAWLALGVGPSSTVIDFGAGTGSFARAIAPHVSRVIAVEAWLRAAPADLRRGGLRANSRTT